MLQDAAGIASLFYLIGLAVELVIGLGWVSILLKIVDGQEVSFSDLMGPTSLIASFMVAAVIVGIAVSIASFFLLIPGIFLGIRLGLYPFAVVDTKAGPMAAISQSWEMTKGNFWNLLGFGIVAGVINGIGALIFGIGLLATIPMTAVAYAYIYRKLSATQPSVASTSAF